MASYSPPGSVPSHFSNVHADSLTVQMQADLSKYAEFYKGTHSNHRLDFDHSLGTASLHAVFSHGEKELSVSLYQAVVLLLFNEQDKIGFADIKAHVRISSSHVSLSFN